MGCTASVIGDGADRDWDLDMSTESSASVVQWKLFLSQQEAKKKFRDDGTLPAECASHPEYLDLRALLDEPIAQVKPHNFILIFTFIYSSFLIVHTVSFASFTCIFLTYITMIMKGGVG